ncbi:MAG TPA: transcriptional repressor LexA [Povalibacter sp.]
MPDLSAKQLEVLAFIEQFMTAHGMPPTRGEIATGLGLRNRQGIDQHLRALACKGAIDLTPGISRGIKVPRKVPGHATQQRSALRESIGLPLLGRIAAGSPILAEGNIEDRIQLEAKLFRPHADFLLRVRGDSMKDADILDRDLLAVHQTAQARDGQIVVARIGDEATVKHYRRQGDIVRLEPANPAYQPIEIDLRKQELTIEGLAVGIIRTGLSHAR